MKRSLPRMALLLLACPLAAMTAGCSSQPNSGWAMYGQLLRQSLHGSFGDDSITRDQAASVPYASLGYRVDGGRENLLVLATDQNGEQIWTSAAHVVLNYRDGRLIRTVGLSHDSAYHPAGDAGQPPVAQALKGSFRSIRLVDLPDRQAYSVTQICTATARGAQPVVILGTRLATWRIEERCSSDNPRWSVVNSYWVDSQTGFVWRSIQHPHPAITVETEILRPPE